MVTHEHLRLRREVLSFPSKTRGYLAVIILAMWWCCELQQAKVKLHVERQMPPAESGLVAGLVLHFELKGCARSYGVDWANVGTQEAARSCKALLWTKKRDLRKM